MSSRPRLVPRRPRLASLLTWLVVLLIPSPWVGAAVAPPGASNSAVASAHPMATAAGVEILEAGGNAFDAAVAVSAALAVVEPYGSGLGGGGFWLLHRAVDGHEIFLDGRERAPLAARRDLYLDAQGEVITGASVDGPLAAGIPGLPAALAHLPGTMVFYPSSVAWPQRSVWRGKVLRSTPTIGGSRPCGWRSCGHRQQPVRFFYTRAKCQARAIQSNSPIWPKP